MKQRGRMDVDAPAGTANRNLDSQEPTDIELDVIVKVSYCVCLQIQTVPGQVAGGGTRQEHKASSKIFTIGVFFPGSLLEFGSSTPGCNPHN